MFQAVATIFLPAEREDEIVLTLSHLVQPTQSEPGCLTCGCYRDLAEPSAVLFLERWRSRDDFERHARGERFRVLLSALDLSDGEPLLRFEEIGASDGLAYLEQVMGGTH